MISYILLIPSIFLLIIICFLYVFVCLSYYTLSYSFYCRPYMFIYYEPVYPYINTPASSLYLSLILSYCPLYYPCTVLLYSSIYSYYILYRVLLDSFLIYVCKSLYVIYYIAYRVADIINGTPAQNFIKFFLDLRM